MKPVDAPFFVAPYKDEPGGVDFLGLRQVNLDLMYEFLPGINNLTEFVRPYSVMTWFAWAFNEEMKREGVEDFNRKKYRLFREKVELLFGWGHQLEGTNRRMTGSTSKAPKAPGAVPLNFEAWDRNASWMDAVNYGPSLKIDNGFGLLYQVKPGIFTVTTQGKVLAEALDTKLRGLSGYEVLRGGADSATEAAARSLHAGWNIESPSKAERRALWAVAFDEAAVGTDAPLGRRSSAIQLIEIVLAAARKPLYANEVRERLAQGGVSQGRSLKIPDHLVEHHHIWVVVQVKQAQRLAMEALFAWLERQVLIEGLRDSHALAKAAAKALARSPLFDGVASPAAALAKMRRYADAQKQPLWRGAGDKVLDIFDAMEVLSTAVKTDTKDLCPVALHLLFLCAALTEELDSESVSTSLLDAGGVARVSLAHWMRYVERHAESRFVPFMVNFLEVFMLSQHFGTATRRYEVGKQRLRVTIEERGLTPMIAPDDLWYPATAPDRIEAMLSLMADCGVIGDSDEGYYSKD